MVIDNNNVCQAENIMPIYTNFRFENDVSLSQSIVMSHLKSVNTGYFG